MSLRGDEGFGVLNPCRAERRKRTTVGQSLSTALHCSQIFFSTFNWRPPTRHESRFHLSLTSLLRYLRTSSFTNNCQLTTLNSFSPARWTSSPLQAILPFPLHRPGWRLSLLRGIAHFSHRHEPAHRLSV